MNATRPISSHVGSLRCDQPKPELELKAFVTRDAQGGDKRVEVSDLVKGVQLDAELFKIGPIG
jgi:hypothetical protein